MWFRVTTVSNCRRVLLAVLNLCVRITVRVATFGTNHYVTDSKLTISICFSAEVFCFCSPVNQPLAKNLDDGQPKPSG